MSTPVQVDDLLMPRARAGRMAVFFLTPVLLFIAGGFTLGGLTATFLDDQRFFLLGFIVGAGIGSVAFLATKHHFLIHNNTTGMFLTLDRLQSLIGGDDVHVPYGPGTHFCYPWEARFSNNNIPVEEVAEDFNFTAVCEDGTVTGTGSFRLRPDFTKPRNYLSGVGSVSKDLSDLVIAFITDWLASRTMNSAVTLKAELNKALVNEFVTGLTPFEERFGVQLGDITVSQLRLSGDVEKTRNALNEAMVVAQGTAILLGFTTAAEMQAALGTSITQDDIDRARREFRIMSGNMEGATVNRFEVDIKGLAPETAAALSAFLQNPDAVKAVKGMLTGNKTPIQRRGKAK